jgi:hypothetical protein
VAEQWLPIPEWEGLYEVSDEGRVLSVRRQLLLKQRPDDDGYLTVGLSRGGKQRRFFVHRLVLLTFDGPCPPGHESRHLNGRRGDNRRSNLEWATHLMNVSNKRAHGTEYQLNIATCPEGHDYTPENTYEWADPKTGRSERHCRRCRRERWREKHGKGLRTNGTKYNPEGA